MFFGAHLKKQPDILHSLQEIQKYGGNFLQIFVSNPMSGHHKKEMMEKYHQMGPSVKQYLQRHKMALVIHSPYTLNFARRVVTPSEAYWVKSYYDELVIADYLGAMGCVIHVGKHLDDTPKNGIQYMYISLKYLIHQVIENGLKVKIILETAAGQGTELLTTLQELLDFYARFSDREKDILKLCVDTAHIFSAGIDIYHEYILQNLFQTFHQHISLIHLNDSKREFNSHVDRHEKIGKGKIGKTILGNVVRLAKQYNIPLILETPDDGYKKEIPWINSILRNGYVD